MYFLPNSPIRTKRAHRLIPILHVHNVSQLRLVQKKTVIRT